MENVLEIKNLSKSYEQFLLKNINLELPRGSIMGFIGENGAGKSTTIKLILNVIARDSGEIEIFGKDSLEDESELKEDIGVVYDECNFPETLTAANVNTIMKHIYHNWNERAFKQYLREFSLPEKKEIRSFSRGMKMKLTIAAAMSHKAKLLILDEPTSGLDPIIRDEILDIFLDFIQNEEHSIFISTHITSDIEKIADYIAFIHQGELMFIKSKDELRDTYGVLKCGVSEFDTLDREYVVGYRKNKFGVEALVDRRGFGDRYVVDNATIEDIMLFTIRGDKI